MTAGQFLWAACLWDGLLTLIGFFLCRFDKQRARRGGRRIRERTFFLLAFFGGGLGIYLGMYRFRHKTLHPSFVWGIPALILLSCLWQGGLFWILQH